MGDRVNLLAQEVACDRIAVMRVLLEAGADPDLRVPADGFSARDIAEMQDNHEALELMRKYRSARN